MARNEDYDWIFDSALQLLESEKFDAAVMDFVDEKCYSFEDDEENKLVYTEIHREFSEHIEALLTSTLGELGVTSELFLESCEKAKDGRDINTTVFERLTAMDDFQTFKTLMTRRNKELQLEAIRNLSSTRSTKGRRAEGKEEEFKLLSPEEMQALLEAEDMSGFDEMADEDVQDMLMQSLMEMELMHRQEELEHLELERAMALSLAVEEERVRRLMAEEKESGPRLVSGSEGRGEPEDQYDNYVSNAHASVVDQSEAKRTHHTPQSSPPREGDKGHNSKEEAPREREREAKPRPLLVSASASTSASTSASATTSASRSSSSSAPSMGGAGAGAGMGLSAEPKLVLRELKPLSKASALPSIPSMSMGSPLGKAPLVALGEVKRQSEQALKANQEQLAQQRLQEQQVRDKLQVGGDLGEEMDRRAKHMRQQRELLVAKKKAERDQKVQVEGERQAKQGSERVLSPPGKWSGGVGDSKEADSKEGEGPSADEIAEMRRATMRTALARRMKMDLIETEEAKLSQLQSDQFGQLDRRLKQVEQLREDNRKREFLMNKQLERQQAQIARNVKLSAAEMGGGM